MAVNLYMGWCSWTPKIFGQRDRIRPNIFGHGDGDRGHLGTQHRIGSVINGNKNTNSEAQK